ncbi:MAG: hypothetical protein LBG57_03440 [Treponema sp.]|jgi:hypothetical protein|nr:hypothetical protein [Treponema sp.]
MNRQNKDTPHSSQKAVSLRRSAGIFKLTACLLFPVLSSCIGVSADITIAAGGSGKIALEYRVSRMAEALGRLDGNERRQTVPVGRADFERFLARLPDMRLVSFSAREQAAGGAANGGDIINRAELEFKNIDALLAFLDFSGQRASFVRQNGTNRLTLTLLEAREPADSDLLALVRELSLDYELRLSLSAEGTASLRLKPETVPSARLVSPGKKVSFTIPTGELLSLPGGLELEFAW